jgi:hypothetical protein
MKILLVFISLSLIIFISCKKTDDKIQILDKIDGVVQKGPFLNGTSLDIYELTSEYAPTGKTYSTQLLDNSGTFQLKNISLVSSYIQFRANGYYFNEITGQNSNSQLTLYAFSDITNRSMVNVNILSNLEKSRIEYLISEGMNFIDAKKQAEQEILAIFSISKSDILAFDSLDISKEGENNAILLAISLIVQGFRTEAELSDLLANIASDIRTDGILNNQSLGSLLINDVRLLNLDQIRLNIENRYSNLGMDVTIPNFEKYIQQFVENTSYLPSNSIEYPEFSNYGENILFGDKTKFSSGNSLAAYLPKGTSLKIIIKGGIWSFWSDPDGPINWKYDSYMFNNEKQTFTTLESGKSCDLKFADFSGDTIEYYENNSKIPTRIKIFN